MKTNIIVVNNTFAAPIALAEFYAGRTEEDESIIELCDVYRSIDGSIFAYCDITNEVVKDYSAVMGISNNQQQKRGRHSCSHNKQAQRTARWMKQFSDDLPF